jgi:hypothetical protein
MAIDNTFIGVLSIILLGVIVWSYFMWTSSRSSHQATHRLLEQHHLIANNPAAHRLSQAVHILHPDARLGIDYTISSGKAGEAPFISYWSGGNKPTQDDIDNALARAQEADKRGYAAMRRAEYPGIEDQLDAAYKARQGDITEQVEIDKKIEEIKNKYPKSDEEL